MDLEAFLTQMFARLREAGVGYCVLRNHEELPQRNPAADVDLLVAAADRPAAIACVAGVAGTEVTGRVRRRQADHVFVAGVHWEGGAALEVDVMTSLGWKGIPYVATGDVLARARPAGPGVRELVVVPDPVDEAIVSLLSSLLIGARVKERYRDAVTAALAASPEAAAGRLAPAFGATAARRLVAAVAARDDRAAVALVPVLRRRLALGALRAHPWPTARAVAEHLAREAVIRWTPRYVADAYVVGGAAGEREALAAAVAAGAANMAKDVAVHPPPPWHHAVSARVPGVRNRALRIWTGPRRPGSPPGPALTAASDADEALAAVRRHLVATAAG